MNSIEDRLDTLESVVDEQQAQIEAHKETIAAQQETIEAQRERLDAVESGGGVSLPISRRGALAAGGALGLLGLGAGTASAEGSGRIGTPDTPVDTIYTETLRLNQPGNISSDNLLRLTTQTGESDGLSGNVIVGHQSNSILANQAAVISGGGGDDILGNQIGEEGDYGAIGGGKGNMVNGEAATVPGGDNNTAAGNYSFAVGRDVTAEHNGAFVVGNSNENDDFKSQKEDEARFQMNVVANAFELVDQQGEPTLDEGEGILYISDGTDADDHNKGDLVYGYREEDENTKIVVIEDKPNNGGG